MSANKISNSQEREDVKRERECVRMNASASPKTLLLWHRLSPPYYYIFVVVVVVERKLKNKRNINTSLKVDYNLKRETKTLVEKIRKLKQLYKKGTLTEIEFEQAKEKLLN